MIELYFLAVAAFDRPMRRSGACDPKEEDAFYRAYGKDPLRQFKSLMRLMSFGRRGPAECLEPLAQDATTLAAEAQTDRHRADAGQSGQFASMSPSVMKSRPSQCDGAQLQCEAFRSA